MRRFSLILLLLGTLMVAAVPSTTGALTVRSSAAVVLDPTKGDSFKVNGSAPALVLEGVTDLVLALDRVSLELPLASFTRKRDVLTYTGSTASGGVLTMRLDVRPPAAAAGYPEFARNCASITVQPTIPTTCSPSECFPNCGCGGDLGRPCDQDASCTSDGSQCLDYTDTHTQVTFRVLGDGAGSSTIM